MATAGLLVFLAAGGLLWSRNIARGIWFLVFEGGALGVMVWTSGPLTLAVAVIGAVTMIVKAGLIPYVMHRVMHRWPQEFRQDSSLPLWAYGMAALLVLAVTHAMHLLASFWLSLNVIAWSPNLAVSWLAIEFSTLASGALIVLGNTPQALEAAWKYIVIASVGLALGLMGIIFIYGSLRSQGLGWQTLSYVNLWRHHAHIAGIIRAVATLLVVGGIGTKVGLVPFHTWLPDAHSEAPSPVSGLLSGVLLGLCLITLVRFIQAVPVPSESVLSGPHLLLGFGMASVAMGALALFVQHDIKRLLAYSSIEQMGIMAIGFGLGTPLAETAALWQYAFHAVIKSTLFFTSGHLTERYHSKNLGHITDLARQHPKMAGLWAVGILALAGLPPLGLAYSEWMILWALWQSHALWALGTMSTALVLTFTALLYHLLKGLWGGLESWPQLGVVARASGLGFDARLLTPGYGDLDWTPACESRGDVAARFRVRLHEVEESWRILEQVARNLIGAPDPESSGVGAILPDLSGDITTYTESPHGLNAHVISLDHGRVRRYHVRSGTFRNWPLMVKAVSGGAVGDFPLINKSFELCYSCTDR
ncbi:proton-conducting transporter membrane subunit [Sulfobacillus thermotolerans]|uniref:proton-conducting transporter transmembrane domain-containing protein n=1 Tax=Sulfobacillus thermotolerans TaxID=338644 RepID=UPI0033683EC4